MNPNLQEKATEAQIQKGIINYLKDKGIFYWRNSVGQRGNIHYGEKGSPDIMALVDGELFGVEVKTYNGKQQKEQKEYEVEFVRNGGFYILARSIDDVSKVI